MHLKNLPLPNILPRVLQAPNLQEVQVNPPQDFQYYMAQPPGWANTLALCYLGELLSNHRRQVDYHHCHQQP